MKLRTFALLAAAGLSLAACGGHKDEEAAPDANLTSITLPPETPANLSIETPAPPVTNTVEATPAPAVTLAPDEQTEEDAAAAGMTARVSRDEEANSAGEPVK
ncbi:MAG: hypothetical protein ABW023_07055 [Sphingomonas sp.]